MSEQGVVGPEEDEPGAQTCSGRVEHGEPALDPDARPVQDVGDPAPDLERTDPIDQVPVEAEP